MFCLSLFVLACCHAAVADFTSFRSRASGIRNDIVSWRRELHRWPELNYQELKTSKFVQKTLQQIGLNFSTGWGINTRQDRIQGLGGTGVVVDIGTGGPPIVALRGDLDGLPIVERTPVPFKSEHDGMMHACGHDGHTSMLLGAAKLLKDAMNEQTAKASNLPGTVRLIFQPAEEGGAGAARMVEEGVLNGVSRVFGFHLWPALPSGTVGGKSGCIMGGEEDFEFIIVGQGAHGAMPHQGVDPIVAASAVVQALQTLVSRETDPLGSAVVSVTIFQAGHAYNVIPDATRLGGTLRAVTVESLDMLKARFIEVVTQVASAHRCSVKDLQFTPDLYPPVINDPSLWEWVQSPEVGIVGSEGITFQPNLPTIMTSEDFSFFSVQVPSAFMLLGIGTGFDVTGQGYSTNASLHNPAYNMDEDILPLGAALHAHLAVQSLHSLQASATRKNEPASKLQAEL